jgi:hypothetical protein
MSEEGRWANCMSWLDKAKPIRSSSSCRSARITAVVSDEKGAIMIMSCIPLIFAIAALLTVFAFAAETSRDSGHFPFAFSPAAGTPPDFSLYSS